MALTFVAREIADAEIKPAVHAARLIDIAVRPTDGHFSNKALLQQQYAEALLLQRQQK